MRFNKKVVYPMILVFILICSGTFISKMVLPSSRNDNYHVYNYSGQQTASGIMAIFDKLSGFRTVLGFDSGIGDTIEVTCSSKVDGEFKIIMLGPSYSIIEEFTANSYERKKVEIKQSGKHIFRIVGDAASGTFEIDLSSEKNIDLIYNY